MGAGGRQGGQLSRSAGGALPQHTRPGEVEAAGHQHNTWQNVRYTLALLEEKGADTSAGVVLDWSSCQMRSGSTPYSTR